MMEHLKIGVVDALRAKAAAVVAANPHAAKRILGRELQAIVLKRQASEKPKRKAKAPRGPSPNPTGRRPIWPWATLNVGEHFDVIGERTRRTMANQARVAGWRHGRTFRARVVHIGDRSSVIRVTRIA